MRTPSLLSTLLPLPHLLHVDLQIPAQITMTLEEQIIKMIKIYKQYAASDGIQGTLSKDELTKMAMEQFPALCHNQNKDKILQGVFGQMDMDGDNQISFRKFMAFFGRLTIALEESVKGSAQGPGKSMTLQDQMIEMMKVYQHYAAADGIQGSLSKDKLATLASAEFPTLCQNQKKDDILKGIFGEMDMDGDNKISFKEFAIFLGSLTIALKESLEN
ncbi:uncharacterized protein [Engystomops pustulosus]|uniref:uncharacterized protein isoform X2 n=1 Tax=Engystomops pustulosus TaxID=76066 RepID=UPI003AFADA42